MNLTQEQLEGIAARMGEGWPPWSCGFMFSAMPWSLFGKMVECAVEAGWSVSWEFDHFGFYKFDGGKRFNTVRVDTVTGNINAFAIAFLDIPIEEFERERKA